MSRTVCIRSIKRVRKSEISKIEGLTRGEIFRNYKNIISLYEAEYLSDRYSSMKKFLTRINTVDGEVLFVANTKILVMCSDSFLATLVEERIRNYVAGTYRDITKLAGQTLLASEVTFKKNREELDKEELVERKIKFKFPEKERGVHIFFCDDMDD